MPNNIEWLIESIRVSLFVNGVFDSNNLESLIENFSDSSPIKINRSTSSFAGVSRTNDGFLHLNWNNNRFDLYLSAEEPQNDQTIAPISCFSSLYKKVVESLKNISPIPLIDRIALGLKLTLPVDNISLGLENLSSHIVGLNVSPSSRDFLFRINHPCESQIMESLLLNRLATWSVGNRQLFKVEIDSDGKQIQEHISTSNTAIRLELDINTDQSFTLAADLETSTSILNELSDISLMIANDGESSMRE